jgi:phosphonate transport system substrate-binding protein
MLKKTLLGAAAFAIAFSTVATTTAFADDIKVFRIGLLGGENEADRLKNNQCLVDQIGKLLNVEVKLSPASDYDGVMQGLLGGTLDFAELGASGYAGVYLKDPTAVDPILTTQQTDGSTGYYSIGLALKSSGIKTIMDAKGKKLGYADPDSTSGFLIPKVAIPVTTGVPNDTFFSATQFDGGHENNVLAMLDGKVDVSVDDSSGIGNFDDRYTSGTFHKMVAKGAADPKKVVEVWHSPLIPNGPLVVAKAGRRQGEDRRLLHQSAEDRQDLLLLGRGWRFHRLRPGEAGVLPDHHRRA